MGEIMGPEYDAAWREHSAAARGRDGAIEALAPRLDRIEADIKLIKRHLGIIERRPKKSQLCGARYGDLICNLAKGHGRHNIAGSKRHAQIKVGGSLEWD